jgi:hypothetical protein
MELLAVGVLGLIGLAWGLGWLRSRVTRLGAAAAALAVIVAALPWQGVDFALIKRVNLFLALAVVAVVVGHRYALPWLGEPRNELRALGALAAASLVVFLNFFAFHGERAWVHLHDVAHYYLGSKYFAELGYGTLYTAMVRAEAESFDGHHLALEARDLAADRVVPVSELLARSDAVKDAFTPVRWRQFQIDVAYFRAALGTHWKTVLGDHGFNPTPVWAAIGGALANRVRAGDTRGIFVLTLFDPLLLVASFALAARAFGVRAALLALIHFCIVFGATFGWTGGAFLRYLWFFGVAASVSLLRLGRPATAGAALGLAAALRIFPAIFLWGVVAAGVAAWIGHRTLPRVHSRFAAGFAAAFAALVGLTVFLPRGLASWSDFAANLPIHLETDAPNLLGLPMLLDAAQLPGGTAALALRLAVFLAGLLFTARVGLRRSPEAALLLGMLPLFAALDVAAYYWVFLSCLTLVSADRARRLVALFGLEATSYALLLFLPDEDLLYPYRALLLGLFLCLAFADRFVEESTARDPSVPKVRAAESSPAL